MLSRFVMNLNRNIGLELQFRVTTFSQGAVTFPLELQLLASADELVILVHATARIDTRFSVRHQIVLHVDCTSPNMSLKQAFLASAGI